MPATAADLRRQRASNEARRFEAFEAWQREHTPIKDAREVLDPQGFMHRRARQLVEERRQQTGVEGQAPDYDPMTDLLGGARLAAAFEASGRDATEAIRNNETDIRTAFTEALLKGGHISEYESELSPNGEAAIGDIAHWELFVRAAPKSDPEVCAIEVHEEFLSAALYNRPELRATHDLVVISPAREDTLGNTMMVRFIAFEQQTDGRWTRRTQQLYLDNSNTADANALLRAWGVLADSDADLDEVAILSRPQLVRKAKFPEGVAAAAEMLDTFATERTGVPTFCGTPMQEAVSRDRYRELADVSRRREQEIGPRIKQMAADVLDMVRAQNLSFAEENRRFKKLLLSNLRLICSDHPEYAAAAFGERAAAYYQEAHEAAAGGDMEAAASALDQAFENSTTVVICDTVVGEETQGTNDKEAGARTAEDIKEALHCLELKLQGYTIRENVNCPACSHITGHKVRAYETVATIRCMNGDCGYKINKEDGSVIRESKINTQTTAIPQKAEQVAQVVSLEGRRLQRGGRYQIGGVQYEYKEQISVGSADPLFVAGNGAEIAGEAARQLHASLTLSGARAA